MIKEALDTGDEDEKGKLEALTAECEQLSEWWKGVLGDKLESTSKERTNIGTESRVRTIGQVDDGSLQKKGRCHVK